jgi:anti-anti-sigma factor
MGVEDVWPGLSVSEAPEACPNLHPKEKPRSWLREIDMQLFLTAEEDDIACVACQGDISQMGLAATDPNPLEELLGAACYQRQVVLDLGDTGFLDTSGVGWLMTCRKRFLAAGGHLILHSVPPMVDQVLRLLHLQSVFTIQPDRAAALAAARALKGKA